MHILLVGATALPLSACTGTDLSVDSSFGLAAPQAAALPPANVGEPGSTVASVRADANAAAATGIPVPVAKESTAAPTVAVVAPSEIARPTATEAVAVAVESSAASTPVSPALPIPAPQVAAQPTTPVLALREEKRDRPNVLSLFASRKEKAKAVPAAPRPRAVVKKANPVVAAAASERRVVKRSRSVTVIRPRKRGTVASLPGVRDRTSIFGFGRKDNDGAEAFRVASAAGLARRGSNGFITQTASVDTSCFKPELVRALQRVERHFGKSVMVTSGYRSPKHNARAGGAKGSKHISCEAADFQIEGVSRSKIAAFLRGMPNRGGVGTYCHTKSVHYDIGSQRDWSWGCRKRRKRG